MDINTNGNGYEVLGAFTTRELVNKFVGQSGGTTFLNLSSQATDYAVWDDIEKKIGNKHYHQIWLKSHTMVFELYYWNSLGTSNRHNKWNNGLKYSL